ncbi:MAG: phosphoglucomutase/phosphomannomutase family protein [Candidatus Omnitrophota bacterium]
MIKFGTDGWRAVIAEDFTFENIKIVSQAISDYLNNQIKNKKKKVVIGYDTRFLSAEFAKTVGLVLAANNIKVVLSDKYIPTPVVSFHGLHDRYDLGIMLTASHNPANFNGLKIKTKEGGSADKSITDKVEKLLNKKKPKIIGLKEAKERGLFEIKDLTASYVDFLKSFVDILNIRKLKARILIDTMYGTGGSFIEKVIGGSRLSIDYIHNEFNPSFGGIHPEPVESNLKGLMGRVKKEGYDMGVALDGDADRIAIIDSKGNYINAQVLLPLLAIHMIKNRKEKGGIGKTVVGSNVIDEVALSLGAACYETPVGFKYLSSLFKENLICVGGEEAGGIGFRGYIPERDASCAFLLLLEMLAFTRQDLDKVLLNFYKSYGRWFYSRISVPAKSLKKGLESLKLLDNICGKKVERINTLDGIKLIARDCWLMFRKSGTEPIVRVYAEAKSQKEADRLLGLGKRMINDL